MDKVKVFAQSCMQTGQADLEQLLAKGQISTKWMQDFNNAPAALLTDVRAKLIYNLRV